MNHIDNTTPNPIDQIQHNDQQSVQAKHEDITALFARLNPQDVEHFYRSYRRWNIQPRLQQLCGEIAELQQTIALNAALMDECCPSPLAQTILAQFQTNGVNDFDLLDRMLERGDDWLGHTIQLLEQCERLDIIHGNYTEWCEHALEGAYDWIGSMSEEDDTPADTIDAVLAPSENAFDETTEQRLLQKLLSEEEETTQPPDSMEQPISDTQPEEQAVDTISIETLTSIEATSDETEHSVTSQTAQEEPSEVLPDEPLPSIPSQRVQEEDEETPTAEGERPIIISDNDEAAIEELAPLPATENDHANEEESATELAAAQNETTDIIAAPETEGELSETIQQALYTTEASSSQPDEALAIETADSADLTHTVDEAPDTATSAIMGSVDSAEMTEIEVTQNEPALAEPDESDEETIAERTQQAAVEEPTETPQESIAVHEELSEEHIEPAELEPTPEPIEVTSTSKQLNELTVEGESDEPQDILTQTSDSPPLDAPNEEQPPAAITIEAEEIAAAPTQSATLTIDTEQEPSSTIEQPEIAQDDTRDETTITQEAKDETIIQELSLAVISEETTAEERSQPEQAEDHSRADTDDDEAIEQPESVIPPIVPAPTPGHATTISAGEEDGSSRGNEDTIAIPRIFFPISKATPARMPAIAQKDTLPITPLTAPEQHSSLKKESSVIEATTIPNLPAVTPAATIQVTPAVVPAPLKEQTEASTVMARLPKADAAYPQPVPVQADTRHLSTPIWREYSTNISNQPASEVLPEPRPGFFSRLWRWFLTWLKGS